MTEPNRAEVLSLIEAELKEDAQHRAQRGAGKWTINAAFAATGWLFLKAIDQPVNVVLCSALVSVSSLALDVISTEVRHKPHKRVVTSERYMSSAAVRGFRPGLLAETLRYVALLFATIIATSILGRTLTLLVVVYFLLSASGTALVFIVANRELPLPAYDYDVPRAVKCTLRIGRLLGIAALLTALFTLRSLMTVQYLPAAQMAAIVTALLYLFVLWGRESDQNEAAANLIDIRRALVFNEITTTAAAEKVEEALVGLTPKRLAIPTGSEVFDELERIRRECIRLRTCLESGADLTEVIGDFVALRSEVGKFASVLPTVPKKVVWAYSASNELNLSWIQVVRKLTSLGRDTDRELRALQAQLVEAHKETLIS